MSHRAAAIVFLAIVIVLTAVVTQIDGAGLFLARRFTDLVHWVAFWR